VKNRPFSQKRKPEFLAVSKKFTIGLIGKIGKFFKDLNVVWLFEDWKSW
jgi:hypothetical protein